MDIQKTIKLIDDIRRLGTDVFADDELEALDMAIEALEWQKRFDDEMYISKDYHDKVYAELQKRYFDLLVPERTRWIPVSERLPEKDDYVLAVFETCLPFVSMYFSGVKKFSCEGEEANPTHWMALPEPPEMTREEADHWDGIAPDKHE